MSFGAEFYDLVLNVMHLFVFSLGRAGSSMYHAVGYGTLMYLQAAMTFDAVSH